MNSRYLTDLCVNDCKILLIFIINDLPTAAFASSIFLRPSCITASWGHPQLQDGSEDPGELLSFPGQLRAVLHIQDTRATQQAGYRGKQEPGTLPYVSKDAFALSEPGSLFVLMCGMSLCTEGLGEGREILGAYISRSVWQLCRALHCQRWAQPPFIRLYSDHAERCSWHQLAAAGWREWCRMQPKAAGPHLPPQPVQSHWQCTEHYLPASLCVPNSLTFAALFSPWTITGF